MSSNKSENLGLHLWEGEDDFLRTEFNENFQVIDAGVKAAGRHAYYSVGTYGKEAGETVFTFDEPPRFLILFSGGGTGVIEANGSCTLVAYYSFDVDKRVELKLTGTDLILVSRASENAGSSLEVLAFF